MSKLTGKKALKHDYAKALIKKLPREEGDRLLKEVLEEGAVVEIVDDEVILKNIDSGITKVLALMASSTLIEIIHEAVDNSLQGDRITLYGKTYFFKDNVVR